MSFVAAKYSSVSSKKSAISAPEKVIAQQIVPQEVPTAPPISVPSPHKLIPVKPTRAVASLPTPSRYTIYIKGSRRTGIILHPGDVIQADASGTIKVGAVVGTVTPDGKTTFGPGIPIARSYNIVSGIPHGALLWRAHSNSPWTLCGSQGQLHINTRGHLEFNIWWWLYVSCRYIGGMEKLPCPACHSHNTNRFGHQNGRQRFICRACQKTWRENPGTTAIAPERKAQILAAYHERVSLRGLSRIFGVSRNTISAWLKKSQDVAALEEHAGQSQKA